MYGISLNQLDLILSIVAMVVAVVFAGAVRISWIRSETLMGFLVLKIGLGLSLSTWFVQTGADFDAAGYVTSGATYAAMLRDFFSEGSMDYFHTTPFWWIEGISTDRFTSLTGLFLVLTGGSFLGATVIACLLGAIGQLLLYRFFRERFPEVRQIYFLPLLLHPSLMLWSGMLLKDSMGIFGLGVAVYSLHRLLGVRQLSAFVPFAISFYVIYLYRSFMFLPLTAFTLFMIWDRIVIPYASRRAQGGLLKALFLMLASACCAFVLWVLTTRHADGLIEDRRQGAAIFSQIEAGSSFENVELSLSPKGVFALGMGAVNGLFRPFPWDVAKPIHAVAVLENVAVLVFIWVGLRTYFGRLSAAQRQQFSGLLWGMLLVALIIAAGVGLFTSNSGTISRYRIPMLPFLMAVPCLALGMADFYRRMNPRVARGNPVYRHLTPAPKARL